MTRVLGLPRFYFNSKFVPLIEKAIRTVYLNPTVPVAVFSIGSVSLLWKYTDSNSIVLVTMFYAAILFFNSIFRGNIPIPKIDLRGNDFNERYLSNPDFVRSGNTTSQDEIGFKTEFSIKNFGSGPVRDPNIEFQAYDAKKRIVQSWTKVSGEDRDVLSIEAGDTLENLHIQGGPLEESGDARFYLIIRVKPGLGYSIISDSVSVSVGGQS